MAQLLNDLITSLATILIRYHDSQKINVCIKETELVPLRKAAREYAIKLLKTENFDQEFTKLNDECTKKYPDFQRIDLLTFIKNEIKMLKELYKRTIPFVEEEDESKDSEFKEYKNKIILLLTDFKWLLNTQKTSIYSVHVKRLGDSLVTKLGLHGMIDYKGVTNMFGMLKTSHLCNSGDLVKEELLDRFNLTEESTPSEIRIVAEHICEGHQHALMAAQHQELLATIHDIKEQHNAERSYLNAQLKETSKLRDKVQTTVNEQQEKIAAYEQELHILGEKLKTKEAVMQKLLITLSEQQLKIEEKDQEIKLLESKLKQMEEALSKAHAKINEQSITLESLTSVMERTQEELQASVSQIKDLQTKLETKVNATESVAKQTDTRDLMNPYSLVYGTKRGFYPSHLMFGLNAARSSNVHEGEEQNKRPGYTPNGGSASEEL